MGEAEGSHSLLSPPPIPLKRQFTLFFSLGYHEFALGVCIVCCLVRGLAPLSSLSTCHPMRRANFPNASTRLAFVRAASPTSFPGTKGGRGLFGENHRTRYPCLFPLHVLHLLLVRFARLVSFDQGGEGTERAERTPGNREKVWRLFVRVMQKPFCFFLSRFLVVLAPALPPPCARCPYYYCWRLRFSWCTRQITSTSNPTGRLRLRELPQVV